MGRAQSRQTGRKMPMEAATTVEGRRKMQAAQRQEALAGLREKLKVDKASAQVALAEIAKKFGDTEYRAAMKAASVYHYPGLVDPAKGK